MTATTTSMIRCSKVCWKWDFQGGLRVVFLNCVYSVQPSRNKNISVFGMLVAVLHQRLHQNRSSENKTDKAWPKTATIGNMVATATLMSRCQKVGCKNDSNTHEATGIGAVQRSDNDVDGPMCVSVCDTVAAFLWRVRFHGTAPDTCRSNIWLKGKMPSPTCTVRLKRSSDSNTHEAM